MSLIKNGAIIDAKDKNSL